MAEVRRIDLNCDLAEGGAHDAELLALVTSANLSCGVHAGDAATIHAALVEAKKHRVRVGAHPSFPDRENFGRRELQRDPELVFQDCVYQIGALLGLARAVDVPVVYLKPHGALYNMACRDAALARPVTRAARLFDLAVMCLPGSVLARTVQDVGGDVILEGFADRRYRPDGSLVPRGEPDAFVADPQEAVAQVEWLIAAHGVQSVCVHGDNPQAVAFVRGLREFLTRKGIALGW